ncbi:CapA family protein [Actinopolymorpha pittospori]
MSLALGPVKIHGMSVRIVLGGDVNLNRADPDRALLAMESVLAAADIRFVNLEGPLCSPSTDPGRPDIPHKKKWRHSPPHQVRALTSANIDVVSCANNVTYPPQAALTSMAVLDEHGIGHCGAGADLADARQPAIISRGGARVGFLAYTSTVFPYGHAASDAEPGVAAVRADTYYRPDPRVAEVPGRPPVVHTIADSAELAAMCDDITGLRHHADIIVVSMHWGLPGDNICDYQRQIAHAAIEAGADIIVGHGAHVIHGIELHQDRPIFYGLGNVVFDWPTMRGRGGGLLATVDPSAHDIGLHLVSQTDEQGRVRILNPDEPEGKVLADRLTTLSAHLGTDIKPDDGHLTVSWP